MRLRYTCVGCPKIRELEYIIENEREITHDTFRKNVGKNNYDELVSDLGYNGGGGLTLKSDWAVSYHKSKTPDGKTVYYLRHSAIEYVFY